MVIHPAKLAGALRVPPSKSHVQRLILCAALADGESVIANPGDCEDTRAAIRAVQQLGLARIERDAQGLRVCGGGRPVPGAVCDCGESATAMRLLMPLAMSGAPAAFTGAPGLLRRPMEAYGALVRQQGGLWERTEAGFSLCHRLRGGAIELPGDISSQFFSGLMLALPLLRQDSQIEASAPIQSLPYLHLTARTQARFGVRCAVSPRQVRVPGGQRYRSAQVAAEGDWSHAAFFAVAGAIGGGVSLLGLDRESAQADRALPDLLRRAGVDVRFDGDVLQVGPSAVRPFRADVSQCPDLAPALTALACAAVGTSRIENAARLRFKESDRLAALCGEFTKIGAHIREEGDGLTICGTGSLRGGEADGRGDHRIAMALAAASGLCERPVRIAGAHCVAKSAPRFFEEFASLGGLVDGR